MIIIQIFYLMINNRFKISVIQSTNIIPITYLQKINLKK